MSLYSRITSKSSHSSSSSSSKLSKNDMTTVTTTTAGTNVSNATSTTSGSTSTSSSSRQLIIKLAKAGQFELIDSMYVSSKEDDIQCTKECLQECLLLGETPLHLLLQYRPPITTVNIICHWLNTIHRTNYNAEDTIETNVCGRTPLHIAIQYVCSIHVIHRLIYGGVTKSLCTRTVDQNHRTPLHYACCNPHGIIQNQNQQHDKNNKNNNKTLFGTTRTIMRGNKEYQQVQSPTTSNKKEKVQENSGHEMMYQIVQLLIEVYPFAITIRDKDGNTPLDCAKIQSTTIRSIDRKMKEILIHCSILVQQQQIQIQQQQLMIQQQQQPESQQSPNNNKLVLLSSSLHNVSTSPKEISLSLPNHTFHNTSPTTATKNRHHMILNSTNLHSHSSQQPIQKKNHQHPPQKNHPPPKLGAFLFGRNGTGGPSGTQNHEQQQQQQQQLPQKLPLEVLTAVTSSQISNHSNEITLDGGVPSVIIATTHTKTKNRGYYDYQNNEIYCFGVDNNNNNDNCDYDNSDDNDTASSIGFGGVSEIRKTYHHNHHHRCCCYKKTTIMDPVDHDYDHEHEHVHDKQPPFMIPIFSDSTTTDTPQQQQQQQQQHTRRLKCRHHGCGTATRNHLIERVQL